MIGAALAAAAAIAVPWTSAPALLDGRCDSAEYADAVAVDLGRDQRALFRRDGERLWLCIPLRPGSLGTMDLSLVTPADPAPVNLHVSAQVGETTWKDGAWSPAEWWNARGWAAPWVSFEGFEGEGPSRKARFRSSDARELALDLSRFGEGRWLWRLHLRNAKDASDASVTTVHPVGSVEADPSGWALLDTRFDPGGGGRAVAVGVRRVDLADRSRTGANAAPLVVPVTLWHPSATGSRTARVMDLGSGGELDPEAVRSEVRRFGAGTVSDASIEAWQRGALEDVFLDGTLPAGGIPWVVLATPLPPWAHDALAERLARRHVGVAHLRSPSVRDLAAAASELPRVFPTFDPARVAIVAFGSAAPAAVLFAMGREDLAAFVSLDGAEVWRSPAQRLTRHPDYQPARFAPPYLRIGAAGRAEEDRRLLADATRLDGEERLVEGLAPSAFYAPLALSSLARRAGAVPGLIGPARTDIEAVEEAAVHFVAERLAGRPGAIRSQLPPARPIRPLPAPAIVHDGRADEPVWATATSRPLEGSGAKGSVRIAADSSYLYVAVVLDRPARFSSEVVLDPRGEGGPAWSADDWWLHSSNSLCESRGAYGEFDGCGRAIAWSASGTQRELLGSAAEYAIAWRKLDAAGDALKLGVRVVTAEGAASWPARLDPEQPATFAPAGLPAPAGRREP